MDAPAGKIRCIFFSEFDIKLGPTLVCLVRSLVLTLLRCHVQSEKVASAYITLMCPQHPAGFIAKEDFNEIDNYVIPKPELCHRLISL